MHRSGKRLAALAAAALLIFIGLFGLSRFGLVGPDEPRYASIGRAMAESGDWITPRLWGAPWFEKPALLYWMDAVAFKAGLGPEIAPRLPVALLALAFLAFYFWYLWQEFNLFVASAAVALLGTSAMWVGFAHTSVTDIPLTVAFSASMLLLLPAIEGRPASIAGAAALLGAAVLAKGMVPVVLALPFLWFGRRYWRNWLRPVPILVFGAVTLPWYVVCQFRNPQFFPVFFIQHQLGRFSSPELRHVQPWWFYLPVLFVAFFPSSALALFTFSPHTYHDRRRRFLATVAIWGIVFFSASRNKLAGYVLPLLPLICALAGAGLDAARELGSRWLAAALALSPLSLAVLPLTVKLLPVALGVGLQTALSRGPLMDRSFVWAIGVALAVGVILLLLSRERALMVWFAVACAGWIYIEAAALPRVDQFASARSLWNRLPEPKRSFCVGPVGRAWQYGLNYYAEQPLDNCAAGTKVRAILPGESTAVAPVIVP